MKALLLLLLFLPSVSMAQLHGPGDQYEAWQSRACELWRCVEGPDGVLLWNQDLTEHLQVDRAEMTAMLSGLNAAYASAPVKYAVNHAADRQLEYLYGISSALDYLSNICTVMGSACGLGAAALAPASLGGSLTIGALCGLSAYECHYKISTVKTRVTMRIEHIKKACETDDQSCYEEITGNTEPKPAEKPVEGPIPRPVPVVQPIFPVTGGGLGHGPRYEGEVTISESPPTR